MKRMQLLVVMIVLGLALGGWLALRHAAQTAATVPSSRPARSKKSPPMDAWQAGIKPDTRTDYAPDPAKTKRLMEKLRQEELRQQPQEGRN